MGHGRRPRPERLGEKLRQVRVQLLGNITQAEMADRLIRHGAEKTVHSGYVADYENNGSREPSLLALLAYSKMTGFTVNVFIDDARNLPSDLNRKRR
ncbi:MAG TPA: helix-turn-helix transcriptional regulator [Blastocatellia bacterium]